jgi:hypothetical protein
MSTSPTIITVSPLPVPSGSGSGVMAAGVGSQPSILTIATPVPLARLGDGSLQIAPLNPQFLQTTSDTLGNFGDATDGFDAMFAIPANSLEDDVSAIGQLDVALLGADFNEGDIAASTINPVGNDLISFTDAGDTILNAFGVAVTPAGNPPPTNNPPPPGGPPPVPDPGVGGGIDSGGAPPPGPGGSGGSGIKCTVISNPITGEYVGVECDISPGGAPGIHVPLQQ